MQHSTVYQEKKQGGVVGVGGCWLLVEYLLNRVITITRNIYTGHFNKMEIPQQRNNIKRSDKQIQIKVAHLHLCSSSGVQCSCSVSQRQRGRMGSCVIWEEADFSICSLKHAGERTQIKWHYQISSAAIPEAGVMLQHIPLSAQSPIKLWLRSKFPSLYQTAHSTSEAPFYDSWLICALVSHAFASSSHPREGKTVNGEILIRYSCVCLFVVFLKLFAYVCEKWKASFHQWQIHIVHPHHHDYVWVQIFNNCVSVLSIRLSLSVMHMCVFDVTVCMIWWQIDVLYPLCCFQSFVSYAVVWTGIG